MAHKAPGKHYREGISLAKLFKTFPNDKAAEVWFAKTRWPESPHCPHCGSDGRGVGFYFRNVTEILLFGVRGKGARTLDHGRRQGWLSVWKGIF